MCEGKGQRNSEKQEVQAKLLLVGEVLPGMSLKGILRTPYAFSQSFCQQSSREELFPRCAVSQAMVMSALEPHKHRDQFLLRGVLGSNKSKYRSANPTESLLTEGINAEVSNSMEKAKAHIYPRGTLTGTVRSPPAQPFF